MTDDDRTVHGRTPVGDEIVRYDISGKWYVEPKERPRWQVRVAGAALLAFCGEARLGRPGGARFDAAVRRLRDIEIKP